ncbi:hypothetical protein BDP27DRAFT_1426309 [Rhodocollybia butyracea]|uniref:Uncharacterized protein n=1 Tax=Rhodocollybia butyracea TaxID=206335 RepID=A0A9P5U3R9_9AGAR|nr:hypothetical protein BDP27DRAFT_1426309 [Rhodocollybia butyracea]
MSASNTDLPFSDTKVTVPAGDNGETEESNLYYVATLVKAFKDGTKLDASYNAIVRSVMKNASSRNAFMEAVTGSPKLQGSSLPSQYMVTDFPKAVEITSDFKPSAHGHGHTPYSEQQLTPPFGTKGFVNQVYRVNGANWTLNVYAYRHINSNNVTLVVLHSGSTSVFQTLFTLWTTPASVYQFHRPLTSDSDISDITHVYHIEYKDNINMLGPDGKNPIVFQTIYKDNFTAQGIEAFLMNPIT